VDLFLVLSGFLIGGKLLETQSSPDYYKMFYTRRARRILPVYLLFLGFTTFCYVFIYPSHRLAMSWSLDHPALPWYLYLTFTANFWMAYHNTFGAWQLSVLWSLAVEEQFYLIAPFLIRFARAALLPRVLVTGILSALLLRCSLQFVNGHAVAVYVLLPCRIDALIWGILAAYLVRKHEAWNFLVDHRKGLWGLFYVLGMGICLASFLTTMHSVTTETIGYDWLDVFYVAALALVLVDQQSWLGNLARLPWLTGLGMISYGLYLFHYTIYDLSMGYLLGHSGPVRSLADLGVALFAIALAIGLATLSWHFLEKPILSGELSVQVFSTHSAHLLKTLWQKATNNERACVPQYGGLLGFAIEDRGVQYASNDCAGLSHTFANAISMSRKWNPYDNAMAEPFMKTLRAEEVYPGDYRDPAEADASIGRFLEQAYNQKQIALRAAQTAAARSFATASATQQCA